MIEADFTAQLQAIFALTAQEGLTKAKLESSVAVLQYTNMEACYQECRRPWRMVGAIVTRDDTTNRWKCEFQGVTAWGDTPDIACDNFDHCWMFGNRAE